MNCRSSALLVLCLAQPLGCAAAPPARTLDPGKRIALDRRGLYPEGIAFDAPRKQFVVGSMREGDLYSVDAQGGVHQLTRDRRLCSVLGVAVDSQRGRVWAANSDLAVSRKPSAAGAKSLAAVGAYDLETGRPLHYADLGQLVPGPHAANGIALDAAGTAYVTDSLSPVIYAAPFGKPASVLLRDDAFDGEGINLNGLAWHPRGYLLVVKKSDGALFRVPTANPREFVRVNVAATFQGGDGVTLIDERRLLVVSNHTQDVRANAAYLLESTDGWTTADVTEVLPLGAVYPTNAVAADGRLFAVHSNLDELLSKSVTNVSVRQASILEIGSLEGLGERGEK